MDGPINFGEKERYWGLLVKGFDKHKEISEMALKTNSITKLTNNYEECVNDSDIILVATPTSSIFEIFENIKPSTLVVFGF